VGEPVASNKNDDETSQRLHEQSASPKKSLASKAAAGVIAPAFLRAGRTPLDASHGLRTALARA
jgi:hypothetical protein